MKKFLITVAAAALAAPMFAQAAPARVAVIDVQRVLASSAAGKAASERLKKMQEDRMTKAKQMDDEMQKLDADTAARQSKLDELKDKESPSLDDGIDITDEARKRAPEALRLLTARQMNEYLNIFEELQDPVASVLADTNSVKIQCPPLL